MKVIKDLLAKSTILLLLVASYMRLTDTVVINQYVNRRGGPWVTGFDSGNSVFLCAVLTGALWCFVVWMDRQRS